MSKVSTPSKRSPATKSVSPKTPSSRTVYPGVYERGIGTNKPYFQVRIRHRNAGGTRQDETVRFDYLPKGSTDIRGSSREVALEAAIAAASSDKSYYHYYGKGKEQVAEEHTLRHWLEGWCVEVCDNLKEGDPNFRKAGVEDAKQLRRIIKRADAYAEQHGRVSIMNRKVVDLVQADFSGRHGLLKMLGGKPPRKPRPEKPATRAEQLKAAAERRRLKEEAAKAPKPHYPASPATKRRALALLGIVWNHAAEEWAMPLDRPFAGVKIKGESTGMEKVTRALSLAEYEAVEASLGQVHNTTHAAIRFLRWTAARSGEMRKLRWEQITWPSKQNDLTVPMIKFVGTKTPRQGQYRERDIPVLDGTLDALMMMYDPPDENGKRQGLAPPTSGIIFPSPTDPTKPISRSTAYQAFVRAIRRAKVPHARLHDLRHTRTTELSAALPKAQAMVITGHSDERTFMRYTHYAEATAGMISDADSKMLARLKVRQEAMETIPGEPTADNVAEFLKGLNLSPEDRMKLITALAK